jgi:nitroreductase
MGFLSQLDWRHACKGFDPAKPVANHVLEHIKDAIHKAPTSFGLQPFYVKVITDSALKAKIKDIGWNQPQYTSATEVLVFVARSDVKAVADEMFADRGQGDPKIIESLKPYGEMVYGWIKNVSDPTFFTSWSHRQAYLALGFGLAACAELKVDSCPMEGFDRVAMGQLLGLPKDHHASVILALGYRDPKHVIFPKWRFPKKKLFV